MNAAVALDEQSTVASVKYRYIATFDCNCSDVTNVEIEDDVK
jgi:hypothetical protein